MKKPPIIYLSLIESIPLFENVANKAVRIGREFRPTRGLDCFLSFRDFEK